MSLHSERLLTHMRRLRLTPQCYSTNRRRSLVEKIAVSGFSRATVGERESIEVTLNFLECMCELCYCLGPLMPGSIYAS